MGAARRLSPAVDRAVPNVTCLGCGCTCDDIHVVIRDGRIVETRNACPLGAEWFGSGAVPQRISIAGHEASIDDAVAAAAQLLARATSPLVYLAPDVSWERLNARVYSELFLTPRSDPWLGLVSPDAFTGIAADGG